MVSRGYTLIELLIAVALIGLAASVALPSLRTSDTARQNLAAGSVARAIRFARSEAVRLDAPHGFRQEDGTGRLRVFRLDMATNPGTPVYDVRDPSSRNLFDLRFATPPFSFDGAFASSGTFRGNCNDPTTIVFDGNGTPWCTDPAAALLEQMSIAITQPERTVTVSLDGLTGRVTVL